MREDGVVVIGTDLNTAKLEAKLQKLKGNLATTEKELSSLEFGRNALEEQMKKAESATRDYKKEIQEAERELAKLNEQALQKNQQLQDPNYQFKDVASMSLGRINNQIIQYRESIDLSRQAMEKESGTISKINSQLSQQDAKIEKKKTQIQEINNSLAITEAQMKRTTGGDIQGNLAGISNGLQSVTKKVIRWGLAVFGVRSAYMFIRQEMGVLSQYNKTIGADIEYMRWAVANALAPVIEKIIQLAYKLLVYVGYIIKELFGINIFANATAKNFERQKSALSGANKQAKQLQKTLAGFDEMNIIQESGDTTRGGGGGGVAMPSQDLSKLLEEVEIPEWLEKLVEWLKKLKKWIVENWDWLSKLLEVLGLVFGASKIAGWVSNIGTLIGGAGAGLKGMGLALGVIGAELAVIAYQSYEAYKKYKLLDDEYKNATKVGENYYKAEKKIAEVSKDTNSSTKDLNTSFNHFNNQTKNLTNSISNAGKAVDDLNTLEYIFDVTLLRNNGTIKQHEDLIAKNSDEILRNVKNVREMKVAGTLTDEQEKQWIKTLETMLPKLEEQRDKLVKGSDEYRDFSDTIDIVKYNLEMFKEGNVKATLSLGDLFKKVKDNNLKNLSDKFNIVKDAITKGKEKLDEFNRTRLEDKDANIKVTADTSSADSGLSGWIKTFASKIQSAFNNIRFTDLANKISNGLSKLFPIFGLSKIKSVFGLAKGGIINMPGRGVPITSGVIGGERGAEGVIPLTDSQQMALLGEAIGKYISINATVPVYVGNRQIARELKKIEAEDAFAYNR